MHARATAWQFIADYFDVRETCVRPACRVTLLCPVQDHGNTCVSLGCLVPCLQAIRAACANSPPDGGAQLAPVIKACSDLCVGSGSGANEACALMELLAAAPPVSLWENVSDVVTRLFSHDSQSVKACVVRELPFFMLRLLPYFSQLAVLIRCDVESIAPPFSAIASHAVPRVLCRCRHMLDRSDMWIEIICKAMANPAVAEAACGAIADIACILCCHNGGGLKECVVKEGKEGARAMWGLGLWESGGRGEQRRVATCPHCRPAKGEAAKKDKQGHQVGYLTPKAAGMILKTMSQMLTVGEDKVKAAALRALSSILCHLREEQLKGQSAILKQVCGAVSALAPIRALQMKRL